MLLSKLAEYASCIGELPAMYQRKLVRNVLLLGSNGQFFGMITLGDEKSKGLPMNVPVRRRNGIRPCLLADSAEYVLGLSPKRPERAALMHQAFVELVCDCASKTGEPTVQAVATFLNNLSIEALELPADFDCTARITFDVDESYPIDLPAVQSYWAKTNASIDQVEQEGVECLLCPNIAPAVEKVPITVNGLPGGEKGGTAIVSAYDVSGWSYGLEKTLNAPICESCAIRCTNALNSLLEDRRTHFYTEGLVYISWTKENNPVAHTMLPTITECKPEDVQKLLKSPTEGKLSTTRGSNQLYTAVLSSRSGRIIIHDWMETTLSHAQNNLTRYFELQRLQTPTGKDHWFPLWQLLKAVVRPKSKEKAPDFVGEALFRLAFHGGKLPYSLLSLVLGRLRAGRSETEQPYVSPSQAALIKMVLLTQDNTHWLKNITTERNQIMVQLEKECQEPAYLCGRLLAILEALQKDALDNLNTTIVDRYYGTASTAPASAFPMLMRNAQEHLSKLRRQSHKTFEYYSYRFRQILGSLQEFPPTLKLIEQGLFGLGYWHQNAVENKTQFARSKQNSLSEEIKQEAKADGSN